VNHADAVFSISKYVTGTVISMGRDPASIHTILNCVDPSAWNPATDGTIVRQELGISPATKVLASVSRLFHWKGQRELLQAFASVRQRVSDVVLLIVGADAPHEGTSFTEELKRLASELGVAPYVHFTGARSDVARVMAACDVYTMPSFEEPFGLVFLEAMAMGKPVVAVDNGGTPEVVAHGETGLLSPPWDIPALSRNIVRLLEDPALGQRMGQRGRERVLTQFNPQRMAEEAGRAYETIVGRADLR
jgi:glycosyltransferase involved in cell wall biosynthesis